MPGMQSSVNTILRWGTDRYGPDFASAIEQDLGLKAVNLIHIRPSLDLGQLAVRCCRLDQLELSSGTHWFLQRLVDQGQASGEVTFSLTCSSTNTTPRLLKILASGCKSTKKTTCWNSFNPNPKDPHHDHAPSTTRPIWPQAFLVSLGSWVTVGHQISKETAKACLNAALDHGVNFIDSAEAYANGAAEVLIGELIQDHRREQLVLSSKVFWAEMAQMTPGSVENMFMKRAMRRLNGSKLTISTSISATVQTPTPRFLKRS